MKNLKYLFSLIIVPILFLILNFNSFAAVKDEVTFVTALDSVTFSDGTYSTMLYANEWNWGYRTAMWARTDNAANFYFYKDDNNIGLAAIDSDGEYHSYEYIIGSYVLSDGSSIHGYPTVSGSIYGYASNPTSTASTGIMRTIFTVTDYINNYSHVGYKLYDSNYDALIAASSGDNGRVEDVYLEYTPTIQVVAGAARNYATGTASANAMMPYYLHIEGSDPGTIEIKYRMRVYSDYEATSINLNNFQFNMKNLVYSRFHELGANYVNGDYAITSIGYTNNDFDLLDPNYYSHLSYLQGSFEQSVTWLNGHSSAIDREIQWFLPKEYEGNTDNRVHPSDRLVMYEIAARYNYVNPLGSHTYSDWTYVNTSYNNPYLVSVNNIKISNKQDVDNSTIEQIEDFGATDLPDSTFDNGTGNGYDNSDWVIGTQNIDVNSVWDNINSVWNMVGNFPSLLAQIFSFLPPWLINLIAISIALIIIIGIIKALL